MRITLKISLATFLLILFLAPISFAFNSDTSTLTPTNKVSVYQNGKVVGEITQEMPLIENQMLSCDGKCSIKTDTMALVAEDKSLFAIGTQENTDYVQVENGIIYFGITQPTGDLVFVTPKGAVTVHQVIFNASAGDQMVKGYIKADEGTSEIGVIDGGSLSLLTQNGNELVKSGNRFILAQADIGTSPSTPPANTGNAVKDKKKGAWWKLSGGETASLAAAAAVGGGIAYGVKRNNDGGGKANSPASPDQQ